MLIGVSVRLKSLWLFNPTLRFKSHGVGHVVKLLFVCIVSRARRSMGKMSTSVTALLNETEDFGDEGSEVPEEEEQYLEDSLHGQSISPCWCFLIII